MVRQTRSEVTRQKIIDAAADLFIFQGYGATGLSDIINRVGVTKGALYYHFDSKESLAQAIVADGAAAITKALAGMSSAPAPAFENMIHILSSRSPRGCAATSKFAPPSTSRGH